MNAQKRFFNSSFDVKLARRRKRRASMLNHSSIWLSHEQCRGVNTNRIRCSERSRYSVREALERSTPDTNLTPRSDVSPIWAATYRTRSSDLWVSRLSTTKIQRPPGSTEIVVE